MSKIDKYLEDILTKKTKKTNKEIQTAKHAMLNNFKKDLSLLYNQSGITPEELLVAKQKTFYMLAAQSNTLLAYYIEDISKQLLDQKSVLREAGIQPPKAWLNPTTLRKTFAKKTTRTLFDGSPKKLKMAPA